MNERLIQTFKEKLQAGKPVFGPFMKTSDPGFVEAAGYAGMDFAILDMEHGPVNIQDMQNNIRAAQVSGILPVVRVAAVTEEAIGYGDSVAIMILGGYLGFWKVVGVLAAAFFTSGVCSVILAFRGRVKTMPFFPFLTLGYILMLAEQGGAA